jgi:hypothetical protein
MAPHIPRLPSPTVSYALVIRRKGQLVWPSRRSDVAASMTKADVFKVKEQFRRAVTVQPRDFVLDTERTAGKLATAVKTAESGSLNK